MAKHEETAIELEIRISNMEKSFDELSDMVSQQWKLVEALKRKIIALESQLERKQDRRESSDHEPPPHY